MYIRADKMLEGNLAGWTSIPPRGSRNIGSQVYAMETGKRSGSEAQFGSSAALSLKTDTYLEPFMPNLPCFSLIVDS